MVCLTAQGYCIVVGPLVVQCFQWGTVPVCIGAGCSHPLGALKVTFVGILSEVKRIKRMKAGAIARSSGSWMTTALGSDVYVGANAPVNSCGQICLLPTGDGLGRIHPRQPMAMVTLLGYADSPRFCKPYQHQSVLCYLGYCAYVLEPHQTSRYGRVVGAKSMGHLISH